MRTNQFSATVPLQQKNVKASFTKYSQYFIKKYHKNGLHNSLFFDIIGAQKHRPSLQDEQR